jgi:hypothetical protein
MMLSLELSIFVGNLGIGAHRNSRGALTRIGNWEGGNRSNINEQPESAQPEGGKRLQKSVHTLDMEQDNWQFGVYKCFPEG